MPRARRRQRAGLGGVARQAAARPERQRQTQHRRQDRICPGHSVVRPGPRDEVRGGGHQAAARPPPLGCRRMIDAFAALLDEPRWLAWREEERRGRRTKIPYAATPGARGPGSSTKSATWGTHTEAKERTRQLDNGNTTGCGIVLGDIGDQLYLAGLDLDSSLDENGALAAWAVKILSTVQSYAEVSPSGRGLKAFFYIAAK